jgi:hypothetical protein
MTINEKYLLRIKKIDKNGSYHHFLGLAAAGDRHFGSLVSETSQRNEKFLFGA